MFQVEPESAGYGEFKCSSCPVVHKLSIGNAPATMVGSGIHRLPLQSNRLARMMSSRMITMRTLCSFPATLRRPWTAVISGLYGAVLVAAMYVALRDRRWPLGKWRAPDLLLPSFANGAAPRKLAAWQYSMWPNSGIQHLSIAELTGPMPAVHRSASLRSNYSGSD